MLIKRENLMKYSQCFVGATLTVKNQTRIKYGKGTIISVSDTRMQIDFGPEIGIRKFQYPDPITKGLVLVDGLDEIIKEIGNRLIQEHIDSLLSIIDKRNIRNFVHYTRVRNLKSILDNGLCSLDFMSEHGVECFQNDKQRLDGRTDSISLSVSFPNYKYFFSVKDKDKDKEDTWCVILLDPRKVIALECAFFWTNAANSQCREYKWEDLCGADAFDRMFDVDKRNPDIPSYYTTDPQAEIMVKGHIPADCIKNIVFKSSADIDKDLLSSKCICDRSYFGPRKDYRDWIKGNLDDEYSLPLEYLYDV